MTTPLLIATQTAPLLDVRSTDEEYLTRRFQLLKGCGFQAIDFNMDQLVQGDLKSGVFDRFWEKSLPELHEYFTPIKRSSGQCGISIPQMHAAFPLYIPLHDEATEYVRMSVEKTLAVAAFLNCPAVVVHPYSCRDKELETEINLALYRRFMPFAKEYGVTICLENLTLVENGVRRNGACATPEEACRYVDTLNAEAGATVFGFCFDVGHATLLQQDPNRFVRALGPRLTCLHLHDNDGHADLHVIPFTQQRVQGWSMEHTTDWDGLVDGLRHIGYSGALSFEAFKSFLMFPTALEPELLRLCSATGRYFRNQILNKD